MELKTDDVISMVNEHSERVKLTERSKKRQEERKQKQELTRKKVAAAVIFAAGLTIGSLGESQAKPYFEGKNEIIREFDNAIEEYGIRNYSTGFQINKDEVILEFDEGVNSMINTARSKGMNDVEIAIGLNSYFNDRTTKNYIDTTFKERANECIKSYHTSELLKAEEKTNEGNVKGNGK